MILIHIVRSNMFREIALKILLAYYKEGGYLNILINNYYNEYDLSRDDRNKVTRIVYGTVQYQIYLMYQIEPFIKRIKVFEKTLLLMSTYQHYFMDSLPDYAIVNDAVDLAKKYKGKKTGNFINAVLNNVFIHERSLDELDELEKLSIETSHPYWMVRMFEKQYGYEITRKMCLSNNEVPHQCGRVNSLLSDRTKFLNNPLYQPAILSSQGVYYLGGNIADTREYKEGLITVQDESSQLAVELLKPNYQEKVLDMCGAPGSKSTHLSEFMKDEGELTVIDLFEHKINLIKENCKRMHIHNIKVIVYDSTKLKELYDEESFDCILLDAPCSGLGDLRRKPEIRYHDSNLMDTLIPLQSELLENAYYLLKKGGRMLYSTCTVNKKENEYQIRQFLEKHHDLMKKKERMILPHEYGSDGFYMCLMMKGK